MQLGQTTILTSIVCELVKAYAGRTNGSRSLARSLSLSLSGPCGTLVRPSLAPLWLAPSCGPRGVLPALSLSCGPSSCGFVRPHLPFVAPLRDWEAYERADVQVPPWGNNRIAEGAPPRALHYRELGVYDVGTNPVTDNSGGYLMPEYGLGNPLSEEISRSLVHGYYATVTYVDRLVGHVIGELKSLEMYDETIIVFNSDHGYQLGEHGTWCKHSLFETSLRIPLFIKAPGIAPSRVPALVENVDIYPTLLDLVGIAAPPHLHGKSLVPVMRDPSAPHKGPVFARYRDGDSVRFPDLAYSEYCLRNCWSPETCSQYCATPHPTDRMLYDHTIDPNEDLNRWNTGWNRSQYAGQIHEMRAALDRHRRERDRA